MTRLLWLTDGISFLSGVETHDEVQKELIIISVSVLHLIILIFFSRPLFVYVSAV